MAKTTFYLCSQTALSLRKFLPELKAAAKKGVVHMVPDAATPLGYTYDQDEDRHMYEKHFKIELCWLVQQSPESLKKMLDEAEVIHIGGGSAYYLLQAVRESGFDTYLHNLKRNITIVGSSAGATVLGPDIGPIEPMDDPSLANITDTTGIGLLDFIPVPHVNSDLWAAQAKEVLESGYTAHRLQPIRDEQAICVKDGQVIIL